MNRLRARVSVNADGDLNKRKKQQVQAEDADRRERNRKKRVIMVAKGSRKRRNRRLMILKMSQVMKESHWLRNRRGNTHLCGNILQWLLRKMALKKHNASTENLNMNMTLTGMRLIVWDAIYWNLISWLRMWYSSNSAQCRSKTASKEDWSLITLFSSDGSKAYHLTWFTIFITLDMRGSDLFGSIWVQMWSLSVATQLQKMFTGSIKVWEYIFNNSEVRREIWLGRKTAVKNGDGRTMVGGEELYPCMMNVCHHHCYFGALM